MILNLTDSVRQRLVEHYEDLRRGQLLKHGGTGQGLALFMRDGMMAWMQAWMSVMEAERSPPQTAPSPLEGAAHVAVSGDHLLPAEMYPQISRILTNMALSTLEEQWS
jgi:hypothetical protein